MTDTAPTEETPAPEEPSTEETASEAVPEPAPEASSVPPEIQAKIDAVLAEVAAKDEAAAQVVRAQEERNAKLVAAKNVCFATCKPISDALAATTDLRERKALAELEDETHAQHREMLEQAYLEHSGQRAGDSNPAPPGTTELSTNAVMSTGTGADASIG